MSSLRWSSHFSQYANKLVLLILWGEGVCLCDLGSRHGYVFLAAGGTSGCGIWRLGDCLWEILLHAHTILNSLSLTLYIGSVCIMENKFYPQRLWSVTLVPESTDHTQSSFCLPLNMLSVSHSTSGHIFQCYFQCSLRSILNIISLKINCCSRKFHWWISKKIWRLQDSL